MITLMKKHPLSLVMLTTVAVAIALWAAFYPIVARGAFEFKFGMAMSSPLSRPAVQASTTSVMATTTWHGITVSK